MRGLFLIGMLSIIALWLVGARRRKNSTTVAFAGLGLVVAAGLALSVLIAQSFFGALRHLSDLVFVAVPVSLVLGGLQIERRRIRWTMWIGALGLVGIYIWSTQIEPYWLEVSHHRIESPKIHEPIRLVVVADLQTDRWSSYEDRVIRTLVEQRPDVLLFTGDYFQTGAKGRAQLAKALHTAASEAGLSARLGAYAVDGDVEAGLSGPQGWHRLFDGLPIEAIVDTKRFDAFGLTFTALSVADSRARRSTHRPLIEPSELFHIAFGHAPDFALKQPPADLMLAGHTHGGQVQLPFLGPVITLSDVPRSWAAGRTDFADGRTLIVSRGLGMERGQAPRLRFLCRPELVVVDLIPAS